MHATPTHHPHQQPMRGWRHAIAHGRARIDDLRLRTTLGPLGPVDGPDGIAPAMRDRPYRPDR